MEDSLMQIVEKWELENAKLKPYLNAFGGTLPKKLNGGSHGAQ